MSMIATRDQVPQLARPGIGAPRPAGAPHGTLGLTGRDILGILRRRKWFIIGAIASCVALTVVLTFVWLAYAPLYTADAWLIVNAPQQQVLSPNILPGEKVMEREVALWASLTKSRQVLNSVLDNDDVKKTAWYRKNKDKGVIQLIEDVKVSPVPDSNSIRVSLTDWNAGEATVLVKAVTETAVASAIELSRGQQRNLLKDLDTERSELIARLATTRGRMAAARPADIPFIQERINILNLELQSLVKNLTDLGMAETAAEADLRAIEAQEARTGLDKSPDVLHALELDPTLRQMEAVKVQILNERDNALRKYGLRHPVVQGLDARLANIESQRLDREKELVGTQSRALKQLAESRLENIRAQLFLVKEQLDEKKVNTKDLEQTLARMRELGDEETAIQDRLNRLDARIMEVRVIERGHNPLIIGRPAERPLEPSMPRWGLMIPAGLALGLLVGFGLPLLLELMDTSVKGPSDVAKRTDLPVLGMIPHADDLDEEVADVRLAFSTNPASLLGESFRQIRTCLQFSGPPEKRRSLLIASPLPEDGRTTVATNLGAATARSGKRVLVIDANFRQPMFKELFPGCPEAGLSNALVGHSDWRTLVHQVEPNLSVLAAGPMPPNPAELLGSEPMRQLVTQMMAEYDHVLIDGAPCLVVTDSAVLSTIVDSVVIVVRAGANTYGVVQRTRDMINRVGGHIVGVALNGVRVTAGGYLRKNYDQFYQYHERTALPAKV